MNPKEKLKKLVKGIKAATKLTKTDVLTEKDMDLIYARSAEETKKLIADGANVNAKNIDGETALIWTIVSHNHTEPETQVKMLIKAGADVNAKDNKGYTALSYAREVYSHQYSKEKQAMFKRIIDMLIAAGADIKAKDPAHYAPHTEEQVKVLINSGANIDARTYTTMGPDNKVQSDWTGLMYSMITLNIKVAKLLIKAGADVNAKDKKGRTPLMFAIDAEKTKLLIEAGADVNAKDKNGKTPLMYAQTADQTRLLIEAGADVNAKDNKGRTALNYAQEIGRNDDRNEKQKQRILLENAKYSSQTNRNKGKNKSGIKDTILTKMKNLINRD